ncbi:hypothetical protein HID58_083574 [Brassica napus]|uniref:HMA domain-containing protein n=1 Tax=Brassica napus TaxID=3708 RepID=A0ABQ7YDY8_BRANA|nr:hypothetical protein HID58_083574 [Brassica napus]
MMRRKKNQKSAMAPRRKISKEDVIEKLKDDGDFDSLRLQIIRRLKDNEELRNKMISVVKESRALNRPDAQTMKTRQLSDAIFQEVGSKMLSQLSDGLWGIIRSEDGMKNEIRDTVQSVYTSLSNPGGVQEGPSNTRESEHNIPTSSTLLHLVATTTATVVAASAILNAIAFSSSSSSSPTNLEPQSLNFSRPSPRGLGLARSFASSPMTTVPASDSSNLSQEDGVMPQLLTEFMVDMKCEGCVNAVKSKLETIEGIEKVDMDLANQVVRILGSSPVKTMSLALEQTSRKARLIGQGVPQDFLVSAAVAEFKGPDIFGVVSMELARIEANFTGLSPGNHSWSINEYGDLTNGAASTGNLYNPFQDPTITEPLGDLGTLEADQSGEAFYSGKKEKLKVADLIGRALVVYKTEDKKSGPGLTAAVIARSAGVGENYKKLCTCDGTVIWEATNSDFVTSSV